MKKELKVCLAEMLDGELCGRPLFDEEYCIFHSNKIEKKKEDFEKVFWEEFKKQGKEEEVFDFTGFIFPNDITFEKKEFNKPLFFNMGTFYGKADFEKVVFFSEAYFEKVIFSKKACFEEAIFSEKTYFEETTFSDEANFKEVIFSDEVNFGGAKFFNKVYFSGAEFSGIADFGVTKFSDEADFRGIIFSSEAYFAWAEFFNKADFEEAIFSNIVDFEDTIFSDKTNFEKTTFSDKANFWGADLSEVKLTHAYFEDVLGLFEELKEIKRILKIFKTIKYKISDFKFILGPKAEAKYPIIAKKAKDAYFLADFKNQHPIIYCLWNITSKCGQSLARWAIISIVLAFLFGFIYADYSCPSWLQWMNWGNWMEKVNPIMAIDQTKAQGLGIIRKATWFTPYYFSIVTFTTLGFGDVTPVNLWGEICLAIEVILGYIMLGGLISIFANKLAMRS